jgi:hypothetical protein
MDIINQGKINKVREELQDVVLGQIPDGTLTDYKLSDEPGQLKSQLAEMTNAIMTGRYTLQRPSEFTWEAPINIYRDFNRVYFTDYNIALNKNTGGASYYVDVVNGNDTNNGLTLGTALKNIQTAVAKSDVITIYLANGGYNKDSGFNGIAITKNINIIGLGDSVICDTSDVLTDFISSANPNLYRTTRVIGTLAVYDTNVLDANGDYTKLTKQTDLTVANNTPGSYYTTGSYIFVHPADSRDLTGLTAEQAKIVSYVNVNNLVASGNIKIYIENLKLEGGTNWFKNTGAGQNLEVFAKNCKFKYTSSQDVFDIDGASLVVVENCLAARAYEDGFNYHALNNVKPKVIEINCVGRHNGHASDDTDNGSTMHEGGSIIRLNGEYHHNVGPNVADVSPGNRTWNIACDAHDSLAQSINRGDFFLMYGSDCKMWNEACKSSNSPYSIWNDNGNMYLRNCDFEESYYVVNGGTVELY